MEALSFQTSEPNPERHRELIELLRGVAAGDEAAFAALYDRTSALVFGLVRRIVGDESAAEDVLLDVYMQVWRQASSYNEVRGRPTAWLLTIARSRALDHLRSTQGRERRRAEPLDTAYNLGIAGGIEEAAEQSEIRAKVRAALDELPVEQREVVELAYFGGLSQSEIAAYLNQPLGTVKTRARLALMKLREALKFSYEELM